MKHGNKKGPLGKKIADVATRTTSTETAIAGLQNSGIDTVLRSKVYSTQPPPVLLKHQKTVSGFAMVAAPNNAAGGVEAIIKGQSLKNELNYNNVTFAEWGVGTVGVVTKDATGIEITAENTYYVGIIINTAMKANTKYLILYNVLSSSLTTGFSLGSGELFPTTSLPRTIGNQKAIATTLSTIVNNRMKMQISLSETTGNKIKLAPSIRVFELPAGSQIETDATNLTADQLAIKYPYIKGDVVRHTEAMRVKSVGKNQLSQNISKWTVTDYGYVAKPSDGTITIDASDDSVRFVASVTSRSCATTIPVIGNVFSLSADIKSDTNTCYMTYKFLSNGVELGGANISTNLRTYSTKKFENVAVPSGTTHVVVRFSAESAQGINYKNYQFEQSSVATPYEPYREAIVYASSQYKRVPNGAADEVNLLTGGKTLKVQEYTFQASDIYGLDTSGVDDVVQIYKPTEWRGSTIVFGARINMNYSNLILSSNVNLMYVYVTKGTYADLSAAKAALAGTKMWYQLATPIISKYNIPGVLRAFPNGTVFAEPCISGYTNTAVTVITDASKPIKAIRKVVKLGMVNGQIAETDVTSAVTITDSSTSITIASFDSTALYFYDCEYDSQYTTAPEILLNCEVDGGSVTHDYGAAAVAWVLTDNESRAKTFLVTNAGGAANMVMMPQDGDVKVIRNTSAQTITVKTASSTGITIATGKVATVYYSNTTADFIKTSEV